MNKTNFRKQSKDKKSWTTFIIALFLGALIMSIFERIGNAYDHLVVFTLILLPPCFVVILDRIKMVFGINSRGLTDWEGQIGEGWFLLAIWVGMVMQYYFIEIIEIDISELRKIGLTLLYFFFFWFVAKGLASLNHEHLREKDKK